MNSFTDFSPCWTYRPVADLGYVSVFGQSPVDLVIVRLPEAA